MKYIANLIWAFSLTWILLSVIQQHAVSDTAKALTNWVFRIPFSIHVLFWWAVFSFPRSLGQVFSLMANALLQGVSYAAQGTGQLVEHTWKYRAGKLLIGGLIGYLMYIFIF